jgi:hypothetical protein
MMTLCAAFAASTGCSLSWSTLRLNDATFILAAQESGVGDVTIHVRSPVTVSPLRSSKCTADVLVTAVASGKAHTLILPSRFPATNTVTTLSAPCEGMPPTTSRRSWASHPSTEEWNCDIRRMPAQRRFWSPKRPSGGGAWHMFSNGSCRSPHAWESRDVCLFQA